MQDIWWHHLSTWIPLSLKWALFLSSSVISQFHLQPKESWLMNTRVSGMLRVGGDESEWPHQQMWQEFRCEVPKVQTRGIWRLRGKEVSEAVGRNYWEFSSLPKLYKQCLMLLCHLFLRDASVPSLFRLVLPTWWSKWSRYSSPHFIVWRS